MRSLGLVLLLLPLPVVAAVTAPAPAKAPPAAAAPAPKPSTEAAAEILITFRADAEVIGATVRLGDIAIIESTDENAVQALQAIEVGSVPLVGRSGTITQAYAKIKVRQLQLDPKRLQFGGAQLCTVNRPDQVLAGAEIEKAACEAVRVANADLEVVPSYTPADVRLPVGKVELRPLAPRMLGSNSGSVLVQLLVDHRQVTQVTVNFRLVRRAPVVVAVRDLPAGTVLAAGDVEVQERPAVAGPLQISDPEQALGRQAATPIKAGTTLTNSMLKNATVVKRGTRVKLICRGAGFTITAAGEALQDGATGQLVRVRNLTSRLEVTGTAIGDQLVEVPL